MFLKLSHTTMLLVILSKQWRRVTHVADINSHQRVNMRTVNITGSQQRFIITAESLTRTPTYK